MESCRKIIASRGNKDTLFTRFTHNIRTDNMDDQANKPYSTVIATSRMDEICPLLSGVVYPYITAAVKQ